MFSLPNYNPPRYSINDTGKYIISNSVNMLVLFKYINHLTETSTTVLIRGETGTGKELVAQAIHHNKPKCKCNSPFAVVTCSGIPQELLESILFGYVKGAFTGANTNKKGYFEHLENGTIFLDEIGDMSSYLQAKILRAIQEKEITPVGSNESKKVNVRILSATNIDLESKIERGEFRADLFHRLNVFPIHISPLRERKEDIEPLCNYFIEKFNASYERDISGINHDAIKFLQDYSWPGNVRELENVIERVFVYKKSGKISRDDIFLKGDSGIPTKIFGRELIGDYIKSELNSKNKDQDWLAKELGISLQEVSMYINGEDLPTGKTRTKLINLLDLDPFLIKKLLNGTEQNIV